jgi:hypothetical protein
MLRLRGHGAAAVAAAVIVSTLDRNDMRARLAPMFCREQPRFKVGAGVAAPLATTAYETPTIHHIPCEPFLITEAS